MRSVGPAAGGLIVAVNRELETMFAATAQDLVGQPVEVLLPVAVVPEVAPVPV